MRKNKTLWASVALLPILFSLSGCFDKTDCNDSTSKETALSIITAEFGKTAWFQEMKLAMGDAAILENIQTSDRNQNSGAASCKASYSFTYNSKPKSFNVDYDLSYLQDKGTAEVSVYLTALQKQFLNLAIAEPPVKNGEDIRLDPATGQILTKVYWKNNQLDGVAEAYDPKTSALVAQTHYENGKKTGVQKNWSPDGQQQWGELNWVNGKATGYEKKFVDSKQIVDIKWQDGVQTGFRSTYQVDTFPFEETNYSNGRIVGTVKKYAGLNRLLSEEIYDGGDKPSKVRQYAEGSGKLVSEKSYDRNGDLHGVIRYYREDGSLEFEEQYANGVRTAYSDHTQ